MNNTSPTLRFELPFDEALFIEQSKLIFDDAWAANIKKAKTNFVFIILAGVLSSILIIDDKPFGYIMIGIFILSLVNSINYFFVYKKKKKTFNTLINDEFEGLKNSETPIIWEFYEDTFLYKDYRMETKVNWSQFKKFRVLNKHLLIDLNTGIQTSFMLAESEVGKDQFDKIITFLNRKIIK